MLRRRAELLSMQTELMPRQAELMPRQEGLLSKRTDLLSRQTELLPRQIELLPRQAELLPRQAGLLSREAHPQDTNDVFSPARRHLGLRGQPLVCLFACCMDTSMQQTNKHGNDMSRQTEMLFRQTELVSMQT